MPTITSFVPTGVILPFAGNTPPPGWLLCDGSSLPQTGEYAKLYSVIQTTYGSTNPATHFNLPDTRGIFIRGSGTQSINGVSYSGTLGVKQGDQMQGHRHSHTFGLRYSSTESGQINFYNSNFSGQPNNGNETTAPTIDGPTALSNGTPRVGNETRPANLVINYIIKY